MVRFILMVEFALASPWQVFRAIQPERLHMQ